MNLDQPGEETAVICPKTMEVEMVGSRQLAEGRRGSEEVALVEPGASKEAAPCSWFYAVEDQVIPGRSERSLPEVATPPKEWKALVSGKERWTWVEREVPW